MWVTESVGSGWPCLSFWSSAFWASLLCFLDFSLSCCNWFKECTPTAFSLWNEWCVSTHKAFWLSKHNCAFSLVCYHCWHLKIFNIPPCIKKLWIEMWFWKRKTYWVKTTGSMGSSVFTNVPFVWLTHIFCRPHLPERHLLPTMYKTFHRSIFASSEHTNRPQEFSHPKPEPLTSCSGWGNWVVADVDGLVFLHPQH